MRKLVLAVGVALSLAACSAGTASKDTTVIVPQGASLTKAAELLEEAGAIDDAGAFVRNAKLFGGGAIHPGEYEIKKGTSARTIMTMLEEGKTKQRFVMVPQGMPSILVYDRLMAEPKLTGAIPVPAEGSILPDTYSFQAGESRASVVKRMQAAMDKAFDDLWAKKSASTVVKDRNEAITLASIVEKETGKAEERKTVAGVYSNRLTQGIKLQADPTIIYPITKGKPLGRRILRSEIDAVNDYNTYSMTGLPKGPIANPGKASIEAVLNPAKTDYIYFVARGDGGHVFAKTLDEHNANVQKWYAIRRQRGEM